MIQERIDLQEPQRKLRKDWQWVRLGDLCDLVGDSVDPFNYPSEVFAHYSIPAFDEGKTPVVEPGASILSNKTLFPRGAVLFSKLNPRISRVWYVSDTHHHRRLCSTEFLPLIPRSSVVDPSYLVFALQEPTLVAGLRARVAAATKSRERLRPDDVLDARIPLAPPAEQQYLVKILTEKMATVERAQAAVSAQIEAARELQPAYLRQVFDSPEARQWPSRRLGDVLRLRKEIIHPSDKPQGQAVFVGLEHIASHTGVRKGSVNVDLANLTGRKPRFYQNDIVYGYLRPYLNKVWVAEFDGICSVDQYVYSVANEQADTAFIAWFMRSPTYLNAAPIDTAPGQLPRIRTEEVASVAFNLPPLLEQQCIVAQLSQQMTALEQLQRALDQECINIAALPGALLQQTFNGDL